MDGKVEVYRKEDVEEGWRADKKIHKGAQQNRKKKDLKMERR